MTARDGEGLITRIRQMRRVGPAAEAVRSGAAPEPEGGRMRALERRVAHLEQMVEGLQDSVHRESERQSKLIAELQSAVQPAALSTALARDARNRGL